MTIKQNIQYGTSLLSATHPEHESILPIHKDLGGVFTMVVIQQVMLTVVECIIVDVTRITGDILVDGEVVVLRELDQGRRARFRE